jgi:hypothetical protein
MVLLLYILSALLKKTKQVRICDAYYGETAASSENANLHKFLLVLGKLLPMNSSEHEHVQTKKNAALSTFELDTRPSRAVACRL